MFFADDAGIMLQTKILDSMIRFFDRRKFCLIQYIVFMCVGINICTLDVH